MTDSKQTDKAQKYDRQLRLWGDHGQIALELARVCLINATATGTEILKNLILPGVGSFTIVDDKKISGQDIGNNFFVDADSLGQSRARVTTEYLLEMNEDVSGDFVEESLDQLLENNSSFFEHFSLVITSFVSERSLLQLASLLWEHDIPLLCCTAYGMIGCMRIVTKESTVVESHPDSAIEDLRLDRPFPGLVEYCNSIDLQSMNKKDHSHTPWIVITYKYLQEWKKKHNGNPPLNYREKAEFKEFIRQGILRNNEGVPELEENFEEAISNVNTALCKTKIPDDIQHIFNNRSCTEINSESKPFWILARAVKQFVENEGQGALPLRGSIPDMTADSERFIQLQKAYQDQAAKDVTSVTQHIFQLLQDLGRERVLVVEHDLHSPRQRKKRSSISENDIKTFCKNTAFLRVVECRSLSEEFDPNTANKAFIGSQLEDEDSDLVHYVMLRAVNNFLQENKRYPGEDHHTLDADVPKLKGYVCKLLHDWGISLAVKDDFIQEYCRYGAAELHSVAAFLAGAAAQEAIKLITKQYVPVNNTYIYNAMNQTSMTCQL